MPPKASSSKRAASTQEEHEIQLGLEIEDNNDMVDIYNQIYALVVNQKADHFKTRNI